MWGDATACGRDKCLARDALQQRFHVHLQQLQGGSASAHFARGTQEHILAARMAEPRDRDHDEQQDQPSVAPSSSEPLSKKAEHSDQSSSICASEPSQPSVADEESPRAAPISDASISEKPSSAAHIDPPVVDAVYSLLHNGA